MKELGKTLVELNAKNLGAPYARDQELVKRLAAEQQATRYQCRIDERFAQTGAFDDIVALPEPANPRLDFDHRFRPTALPNTPALTPVVEQLSGRSAEQYAVRIREESIAFEGG